MGAVSAVKTGLSCIRYLGLAQYKLYILKHLIYKKLDVSAQKGHYQASFKNVIGDKLCFLTYLSCSVYSCLLHEYFFPFIVSLIFSCAIWTVELFYLTNTLVFMNIFAIKCNNNSFRITVKK